MEAWRVHWTFRVFALALAVLSLSALSGTRLLRGRRSEWDGQPFRALRARAYEFFNKKEYDAAAKLWQDGYRQAIARHDAVSAQRFLNNIGTIHFALLNYRQAIDAFVEARKLALANGDRVTFTVACANLCSLYSAVGDKAAAAAAAEEGLSLPADANLPYRSTLLVALGVLSSRRDEKWKALGYFREAVEASEKNGVDSQRFEAWNHYSQELVDLGDLGAAERAALNAYRLGGLKTVRELRPAYLTLARIHRARGDARSALALIGGGLATAPKRTDRQLFNRDFLFQRAMVRLAEGNPGAALPDLRLALSYSREWREALAPSDTIRSGADSWLRDIYEAYIEAATGANAPAEAFLAVEEERSASLVQTLAEAASSRVPGAARLLPDAYWQDLARLRTLEIARIGGLNASDQKRAAQIRQRLSEAEIRAGANFIALHAEKGENIPTLDTLHGLEQNIGPEEAVLSLHSGAAASVLWALTRKGLEMHRLPAREKLAGMAERFRLAVEESGAGRDHLAAELYSELFGSLSARVLAKRSWIITADDSLFQIPFEALVIENPGPRRSRPLYLVERHATRRIPSALMLNGAPSPAIRGQFLGIGDGIYNAADERWRARPSPLRLAGFSGLFGGRHTALPLELPRLVSSTNELQASAMAWNTRGSSVLLTGANASRERFSAALYEKPAVIHIATHVLSPRGEPNHALIDLGLTPAGAPDVLTTNDVARLRVDGALVVVSGCASAAAQSVRGVGIMGLTRAWLLAGARAVVGSRWPVEDDARDLFHSFYTHLASSPERQFEPGSALQQAQLQMLRSDSWRSDPKYWGAFYLLTKE